MSVHSLKSFNLDAVIDVGHALQLIESNLDELIEMTSSSVVGPDRKVMTDNIAYIKCYYEKAEALLLKMKGKQP